MKIDVPMRVCCFVIFVVEEHALLVHSGLNMHLRPITVNHEIDYWKFINDFGSVLHTFSRSEIINVSAFSILWCWRAPRVAGPFSKKKKIDGIGVRVFERPV